jgi:hypothetical protein
MRRISPDRHKSSKEFNESFYQWFKSWFHSLPDLEKLDGLEPTRSKHSNFSLV